MENTQHFGQLTERMKAFREEVLDEKPYVDGERAVLATEAYKENLNQPRVMVRARMLKKILENMSIYIEDKTLIVGNQSTKNCNAPVFPEYTMKFIMDELDLFEKRDGVKTIDSNPADANVYNIRYDYTILNNAGFNELDNETDKFIEWIIDNKCSQIVNSYCLKFNCKHCVDDDGGLYCRR